MMRSVEFTTVAGFNEVCFVDHEGVARALQPGETFWCPERQASGFDSIPMLERTGRVDEWIDEVPVVAEEDPEDPADDDEEDPEE
jgi:hypothetical protein